jgi:hypothetical protein
VGGWGGGGGKPNFIIFKSRVYVVFSSLDPS